ncbi:MAG TPA: S4 domain-containing protein [Steroidobacteraceae bacterium]|jgi:23S rRNA pseudouridine2605 synthase|nr:S4 domain-containing protein [Steroidobacteraceae bacterium]
MAERLHKLLAQHGFGSRREIEKWILEGRVVLNGRPAQAGASFSTGDRVAIDGRDITSRLKVSAAAPAVLLYNKPQGQPITGTSEDPDSGKSVMESLPAVRGARWLVVNTMQAGDSGLMILTSDGRLADALRRRAESIPAAYVARVLVPTPDFDVTALPRVVNYDEETIEFENIEPAGGEGTNRWFRVESRRAHRRAAVRALFESRNLAVSRVIQVQFADIELPRDLPRGRHRALPKDRVEALYALAELELPKSEERTSTKPRRRRAPTGKRRSGR